MTLRQGRLYAAKMDILGEPHTLGTLMRSQTRIIDIYLKGVMKSEIWTNRVAANLCVLVPVES